MNLKIDHESQVPLHLQVENLLRKLIEQPAYRNGMLLPKEVELAKRLGISRNTVRQATNKLSHEKLLVRKKGIGTKVADNNVTTELFNWYSFSYEMEKRGLKLVNYDIQTSWVKPDQEVLDALELKQADKILKLERLRGSEDGPTVYFISYFHPRVGLTGNEDFSKHLYEMLEADFSTIAAISKEAIRAIVADKELAKKLQIEKNQPILFRERKVYDPGERPVEYNLGYYRADKFTYSIDIKRK
ncbi:MAG: GntR family transcriptional regulator [Bacteroidota bacterium]|jgi:GntR family transcriptional regulator|nr:GntR family transcriptional regulator [Bacteroidota bacterium]